MFGTLPWQKMRSEMQALFVSQTHTKGAPFCHLGEIPCPLQVSALLGLAPFGLGGFQKMLTKK
eukprot:NODE_8246_length_366_cov_10.634069_g6506_i0.p4 GENE.NODE_8246_length_366_cov_10.634069_g6506_i0~~NODE_8246_length_366_cov_10.634069_g6506_i0.p4  ORF type:complete len:63 (-),score=4.00 NODE_8246_length_366_cov_10.634069_g6506_i0:82-270(-)